MTNEQRLTVSSVTFRDEPLERATERLRGAGFSRLDLTAIRHYCDHFDPLLVDMDERECRRVRDIVERAGMDVVSITGYPANPLARDINGDDWVDGVDAYVRMALYLSAAYLVFPPGSPAPPRNRWRGTAEDALPWQREAARRADNAHLHLSIALHSDSLLRTSAEGLDFLTILKMPRVTLAVDPAHLAAVHDDPAPALHKLGAAAGFVVLRDVKGDDYNLPPGAGALDYPAILAALDDIDYHGPLVLAVDHIDLAPEKRLDLLRQGRDFLLGGMERSRAA